MHTLLVLKWSRITLLLVSPSCTNPAFPANSEGWKSSVFYICILSGVNFLGIFTIYLQIFHFRQLFYLWSWFIFKFLIIFFWIQKGVWFQYYADIEAHVLRSQVWFKGSDFSITISTLCRYWHLDTRLECSTKHNLSFLVKKSRSAVDQLSVVCHFTQLI